MKLFHSNSSFFLFTFIICINHVFSNSEGEGYSTYTKHCSSVIPPYNTTARSDGGSLPSLSTTFFTGGDRFQLGEPDLAYDYVSKNLRLRLRPDHYQTAAAGVFKVEGFLHISFGNGRYEDVPGGRLPVVFPMNGFWSEKSRKICMVGSTPWEAVDFGAVLNLKLDDENPTIYTGVVSGSLESTASAGDPAYFDPVLIFDFPASATEYSYSMLSELEIGAVSPSRRDESLSLDSTEFCSVMERGLLSLAPVYAPECADRRRRPRRCSPVSVSDGSFPDSVQITSIQCAKGAKKAKFFATFFDSSRRGYDDFGVGSTVIGEAQWDGKNNRIVGVGCRISDPSLHLENSVGACSMRLSFRQPSVVTMENDGIIVGEIWSSKAAEDSGYFTPINVTVTDDINSVGLPEQRYEYTEMDRARKWCSAGAVENEAQNTFPDGESNYMRFDTDVRNGEGQQLASAYATPVWVENSLFRTRGASVGSGAIPRIRKPGSTLPTRMSYRIRILPTFYHLDSHNNVSTPSIDWPVTNPSAGLEVTAEGEYDAERGHLCMVGCRKLVLKNSTPVFRDCEIVVELDMSVPRGDGGRLVVKGIVRSTRPRTDPLRFDDLIMESYAYHQQEGLIDNHTEPPTYFDENPVEYLYTIPWVFVTIPCEIIALALIVVFLQLMICGCCILPQRPK